MATNGSTPDVPEPFTGIPAEAFDFYDAPRSGPDEILVAGPQTGLSARGARPLVALGAELAPEFGEPHLYRPYRDVRFAKDKSPYKDHQGLFTQYRNGLGWYLQLSAHGLMVAGGWYTSTTEQVARYRAAIDEGLVICSRGI